MAHCSLLISSSLLRYNPASTWLSGVNFQNFRLWVWGRSLFEEDRVLLVKRAHPPIQGQWSIPGGVLEVGEMVREAAVREAREETGLMVEPGELLGVYDRILRDPEQRVQYHYVLIDFLCRPVGGELGSGERCGRGAMVQARGTGLAANPGRKIDSGTVIGRRE